MTSGATIGRRLDRWLDEWKMAFSGIMLATRSPRFLVTFGLTFLIFGTLMNLLSGSTAALNLFWVTDFGGKLAILRDGFLGIFGVGRNFWDWLLLFVVTLLQSILIGLVVLVWHKRRQAQGTNIVRKASKTDEPVKPSKTATFEPTRTKSTNSELVKVQSSKTATKNYDNLQNAGLAAGLAVLGSGCPTCGTTLLAPVLGAIFSSGSYALASTISGLLTAAAILLALFTLKRIGKDAFVLITSEEFCRRHSTDKKHPAVEEHAPKAKRPAGGNHATRGEYATKQHYSAKAKTNQSEEELHA